MVDVPKDWFWEGHVVEAIARGVKLDGWLEMGRADTATRQRGVDLRLVRGDRTLLVEAKGYPSSAYRDPKRVGEIKPTRPAAQAQHWFAHAIFAGLRLQANNPGDGVALGFPDVGRYRSLAQEIHHSFHSLGLGLIFVRPDGSLEVWGLADDALPGSATIAWGQA